MGLKAILIAYVIGGLTFVPVLLAAAIFFTIYTSVPVGDQDVSKKLRGTLEADSVEKNATATEEETAGAAATDPTDIPKPRKGWLTMRRTFEEAPSDGGYVTLVRSFLDARSKDPKRSRPRDMWFVVLKGKVLYLYEDEAMTECEAAIELGGHEVVIYPEDLPDGELFAKRNAICLKPKSGVEGLPSVTREMKLDTSSLEEKAEKIHVRQKSKDMEKEMLAVDKEAARNEAFNPSTPWFIFVRSNVEMEDWYLALIHASDHSAQTPFLAPLAPVFQPSEMNSLVSTLDEQPDVIPMRWLNAILGRIFYSFYRTDNLESFIIGRLMRKLAKVKRPAILQEIVVTEVSVGNSTPLLSKPMLKELTKEGDASMEMHIQYKGEIRITVEATATINLGARFKSYTVKLVLAAVLKELEGNLLVKIKRPPSSRIWYAFTQMPRMVLSVEPIVSDRQITWTMILSTIESKVKEIILESVVLPNMDDISFFDTEEYEHRGGIWADVARKPKKTPEPQDLANTPDTPNPIIDTSDIPKETVPVEELSSSATSLPPPSPVTSAADVKDTKSARRSSTWFAGIQNNGEPAVAPSEPVESASRGRPARIDTTIPVGLTVPEVTGGGADNVLLVQQAQSSQAERSRSRRSSGHESARSEEASVSSRSRAGSTSESQTQTQSRVPPNTASFLNTWKSRAAAADKQAISNSAKEAMRKWGVAWTGLKKDVSPSATEDMPDHATLPRTRTESMASLSNRARSSYAEVRAAFDARRRNEEAGTTEQLTPSSEGSSPIAIPGALPKSRAVSGPSTLLDPSSANLTSRSRSHSETDAADVGGSPEDGPRIPVQVQPTAKPMTMQIPRIHASHKDEVQSMGYVAPRPVTPPQSARNPVYRLWRSPGGPSPSEPSINSGTVQSSEESASARPGLPSEPRSDSTIGGSASNTRGNPPPLPARHISTSISLSRPPLEPSEISSSSSDRNLSSLASESLLKSIASKDDKTRRLSVEGNNIFGGAAEDETSAEAPISTPVIDLAPAATIPS